MGTPLPFSGSLHGEAARSSGFVLPLSTASFGSARHLWEKWPQKLGSPFCPAPCSQILPRNSWLDVFSLVPRGRWHLPTVPAVLGEDGANWPASLVPSVLCLLSSSSLNASLPCLHHLCCSGSCQGFLGGQEAALVALRALDAHRALGGPAVGPRMARVSSCSPCALGQAQVTE